MKKKWTHEHVTLRIGTGLALLGASALATMVVPWPIVLGVAALVCFATGAADFNLPLPKFGWNSAKTIDGPKVIKAVDDYKALPTEKQAALDMSVIQERLACPKCTAEPSSVKLCDGETMTELLFDTEAFTFSGDGCNYEGEHLHVTCGRCGHTWVCKTKDDEKGE